MRRIYKVRLENARKLAEEAGGVVRFGDRIGISKSQASQIIGRNPIRLIGDDLAERIETSFGKPTDWLDANHSDTLIDRISRLTVANRAALASVVQALIAGQKSR